MNDDMGYSDLGCYGGEIQTPNLDRLGAEGLRFTQFYNTARCCPSRASLLTGLHPHQADIGHMMNDDGVDGYLGDLNPGTATIAEALSESGYATCMSGKWHLTRHVDGPKHNWPLQRGFDEFYGIITGASSYYHPSTLTCNNERIDTPSGPFFLTDAISDHAADYICDHCVASPDIPFFSYVAYTAPHWPLQAHPEDVARYSGRFDGGWDRLRDERLKRMVDAGIVDADCQLTPRDPAQPPWDEAPDQGWQARRMEVYAAQIDRMDQGIGRILRTLEATGQWDNTLIMFLADNGGCAEEINAPWSRSMIGQIAQESTRDGRPVQFGNDPSILPGGEDTYQSYGVPWANLSNTPFREYKHWVHEGGISTPFIAHWPGGVASRGERRHAQAQLPDIMATCLDVATAVYPATRNGIPVVPHEGYSLVPAFSEDQFGRDTLFWEHEGNRAVRKDKWKLVRKFPGDWELYDLSSDRTEMVDLSVQRPGLVSELSQLYDAWAERCCVRPWEEILAGRSHQ